MASKGKGAEEREPQNSEEVVQMYQQARTPLKIRIGIGRLEPGVVVLFWGGSTSQMTQELNAIWTKINELDSEKHEHELVRSHVIRKHRHCLRRMPIWSSLE